MSTLTLEGLVCSVRAHGEHGSIVRVLSREHGLVTGYVRGGRSTRLRPILIPGNRIELELRARTVEQLAGATVELLESRAPLLAEPLAAAAIDWSTSVTAVTLPESQAYPTLFDALAALLQAITFASAARQWAAALARYELLLLVELGFGLNLEVCAASGARTDLGFVSPRTGCAVSVGAAVGFEERLFRLPAFLRGREAAQGLEDVLDALTITGHFVGRSLLDGRTHNLIEVRQRLIDRLNRAVA